MQAGKLIKRIFITISVIIGLFILAAILIPILFKGKIMAVAKTEMNKSLNATADFKDVNLSLFRDFPNLSVAIEDLSIVNKEPFNGDTLIYAHDIDVSLNLIKVIKGDYSITNVTVIEPRIHALVNEKGVANWDITKPDTTTKATTASKPYAFRLQHYGIFHAYIEYRDDQAKMHAVIENLTHKGSGDFTSDLFTLSTHTTADAVNFSYGNITYLYNVKTLIDADINVDNKTSKYSFNTDKIELNGLRLSTKGFVQLPDTVNTVMDIQFKTPSNDFKDILSMVPGIYQDNFKGIKTTGKATIDGYVKGTYNAKSLPAYQVNLLVQDGSFQYPDLPQKVSDIQIKMQATNPDGITDHTVVNIEKGHVAFGGAPLDFRLLLKTPVSDPWVDAALKGRLDLSQIGKFMKLEDGTKLSGIIDANAAAKGSISSAQKGNYEALDASGTISVNNLLYASKDYPGGVSLNSLLLTFNPKNVTVSNLKGSYLQSNFSGNGGIDNLLGYYLHNDPLTASLHVSVDKIDVNKWMGTSTSTDTASASSSEPFVVPDNLNINLTADAGTVKYDNLNLTNVKGAVAIHDQTVYLQNLSGNALDGTIQMDGSYSTKNDKKHPDIHFTYNVQHLDIQKTYVAFNTVQKLMPIAKFMSGTLNSQLSVNGKLGKDMMPELNTLSGKGDVLLLDGILSKFAPVDQLAQKLGINQLKNISLKNLKTWFSFENGRVTVQPYQFKSGDVSFDVAGSHGFDQSLDYGVNVTAPRSIIGSQGNALVNNLVSQAKSKGVPVNVGDKINFAVKIGGTITNPKIQTNLKDVAGNAVDNVKEELANEAKKRIDSAKNTLKDTANAIKNQAIDNAKKALKDQLTGKKDTSGKNDVINDTKKKAEDAAKGALNGLFHKKK